MEGVGFRLGRDNKMIKKSGVSLSDDMIRF